MNVEKVLLLIVILILLIFIANENLSCESEPDKFKQGDIVTMILDSTKKGMITDTPDWITSFYKVKWVGEKHKNVIYDYEIKLWSGD